MIELLLLTGIGVLLFLVIRGGGTGCCSGSNKSDRES